MKTNKVFFYLYSFLFAAVAQAQTASNHELEQFVKKMTRPAEIKVFNGDSLNPKILTITKITNDYEAILASDYLYNLRVSQKEKLNSEYSVGSFEIQSEQQLITLKEVYFLFAHQQLTNLTMDSAKYVCEGLGLEYVSTRSMQSTVGWRLTRIEIKIDPENGRAKVCTNALSLEDGSYLPMPAEVLGDVTCRIPNNYKVPGSRKDKE